MSNSFQKKVGPVIPLMIIGAIFFVIGFGIGISGFLVPALRSVFNLTTGQSYLVTTAIFSAFVIFGRPAGWVIKKIGYRRSMVLSFLTMALGMWMFVPSSNWVSFPLFLIALFVGGIGNTLLQASVNPYITILGPEDTAAVRISLMGILNKLAWWVAPVFLGLFIDLTNVQVNDIVLPFYIVTGIMILLGIFIYYAPLPEVKAPGEDEEERDPEYNEDERHEKKDHRFPDSDPYHLHDEHLQERGGHHCILFRDDRFLHRPQHHRQDHVPGHDDVPHLGPVRVPS